MVSESMHAELAVTDGVRAVIDGVVRAAEEAFGEAMRSVVLFGSAAEGRMRATSDVNLFFVLSSFEVGAADRFREPFRFAMAAARVNAMFILEEEIRGTAGEAFAQKFADMKRRHVVLRGVDPFAGLTISREALVRRVQQVLLNLTMRLRELYIERSLREEQCAVTVAEAAGPLRSSASSILELEGRGALAPKEALEAIVRDLGRADLLELLPHVSEAREQRALPPGRAAYFLFATLELARALHRRSLAL
jgi:hypothetical protein